MIIKQKELIKSISYDQEEIIRWIMRLCNICRFDVDPTFSKGMFYKNIEKPRWCSDISPQYSFVRKEDFTNLPIKDDCIKSIMFDPPFVGGSRVGGKPGIIKERFSYYKNVPIELWGMYLKALKEFYRILLPNGILVFKCQDTVENGKNWFSHVEIMNKAVEIGFKIEDLYILLAKSRIISSMKKQKHARKFHSYFLVFIK